MTQLAAADFQLLGVLPSSSFTEVRKAWRGLVRSTHPDISADAAAGERMALLNAAYDRVVAVIGASLEHCGPDASPAVTRTDPRAERHAERRAARRAVAEAEIARDGRVARSRETGRYARDPGAIRRCYARAFA